MFPTIDDEPPLGAIAASVLAHTAVATGQDLARMCGSILGDRDQPIIGIALRAHVDEPVLRPEDVRSVVGLGVPVYVIADDDLLLAMRRTLGPRLALERGGVRIWWPGASLRCESAEHPVVVALDDEDPASTLDELAHQFDLSRPRVREQVELIEDARAFLEHELERAREQNRKVHERLRDAQIECHGLRTRAELAEASLTASRRANEAA